MIDILITVAANLIGGFIGMFIGIRLALGEWPRLKDFF